MEGGGREGGGGGGDIKILTWLQENPCDLLSY